MTDERVLDLQARLGDLVARARDRPEDDRAHADLVDEAIAAAEELLDLEERLPRLQDEAAWRVTSWFVRGSALVLLVGGAALGVLGYPGPRSIFWVLPALMLVIAGIDQLLEPIPHRPPGRHRRHRPAPVVGLLGFVGVALGLVHVLMPWTLLAGLVLLVADRLVARRLGA